MYEYTYKNGVLDGPCIDYDKHGNVIEKYSCTNGDRDYSYTDFYETEIIEFDDHDEVKAGKRKSQRKLLKDGSSSYFEWHKYGSKKVKGKYDKDGLKTGVWSEWYGDGSRRSEGKFEKGNGQVKFYTYNGILECLGNYVDNYRDGKWIGFGFAKDVHERFQNSENAVEMRKGNLLAYVKYRKNYTNGIKTGRWSKYLHPGVKEFEGSYENGEKDGLWTYYLLDLVYDGDLKQGEYEEKIESRGNYVNGEKHGVWYYEWAPRENYGDLEEPVSSLYDHGKFVKEVPLINDLDLPF
jgi:antitoxin component YwqK of YwqJK toxin-antitoxin module